MGEGTLNFWKGVFLVHLLGKYSKMTIVQCTGEVPVNKLKKAFVKLKAKSGVFRLAQCAWKIFLCSRGTSKRILVSVVCSIMKLFKFAFDKNLNFAPQDT
jgi:hypothetical protein